MSVLTPLHLSAKERSLLSAPFVALDTDLRVLSVSPEAAHAGVLPGEYLPCPSDRKPEDFFSEHRTRLASEDILTPDVLPDDHTALRLRIAPFHGFQMAYVLYEYALLGNYATAFLFASPREFLLFAPKNDREAPSFSSLLQDSISSLRHRLTHRLSEEEAEEQDAGQMLDEFMKISAFLTRALSPFMPEDTEERRSFRLSRLWDVFTEEILPNLSFLDPDKVVTGDAEADLFLPVDAPVLFLLWCTLLYLLSDLSDGERITVSRHTYGEDGEIRFSAKVPTLPTAARHLSDLSGLALTIPRLSREILLAQHLAGISASYLELLTDREKRLLTFSLYIPKEMHIPNFKSPAEAEATLAQALGTIRRLMDLSPAPSADHGEKQ